LIRSNWLAVADALISLSSRSYLAVDSRQPSSVEVPMRLIGLAVVLAVSLTLAPLVGATQQTKV
jgi:hypothetical protein